jgi:hypothetical protein
MTMTRPDDSHKTAEYPQWPAEADAIGKPMDTDRFGDATRMELAEPRRSGWRGLFWLVGVIGLIAVLLLGLRGIGIWPNFGNPFAERTTDRSQPVLLKSIQDLARFTAASGNFEVIIDVERDRRFVPDFLSGERVLFIAAGSVDAYVDFAKISENGLKVDDVAKTVEVTLPAPQLEPVRIDNSRSYVYAEERGLVDRIGDLFGGDPNRLQAVYQLAEQKIGEAARAGGLSQRAEENTRKMLDGMLKALGFTTVTITFAAP